MPRSWSYPVGTRYELRTAKRKLKCRKCGAVIPKGSQYVVKIWYEHKCWIGYNPRYYVAAFRYPTRSRDYRRQMRLCMKCYEEELRAQEEAKRQAEERKRRRKQKIIGLAISLLAKGLVMLEDKAESWIKEHPCLQGVEYYARLKDPDLAGEFGTPLPVCRLKCMPKPEIQELSLLSWVVPLPCGGVVFIYGSPHFYMCLCPRLGNCPIHKKGSPP